MTSVASSEGVPKGAKCLVLQAPREGVGTGDILFQAGYYSRVGK